MKRLAIVFGFAAFGTFFIGPAIHSIVEIFYKGYGWYAVFTLSVFLLWVFFTHPDIKKSQS